MMYELWKHVIIWFCYFLRTVIFMVFLNLYLNFTVCLYKFFSLIFFLFFNVFGHVLIFDILEWFLDVSITRKKGFGWVEIFFSLPILYLFWNFQPLHWKKKFKILTNHSLLDRFSSVTLFFIIMNSFWYAFCENSLLTVFQNFLLSFTICTAQKLNFPPKIFTVNADLVTSTEKILHGKLFFVQCILLNSTKRFSLILRKKTMVSLLIV